MKKSVKLALVGITAILIVATVGYILLVPTKAEVRVVAPSMLTQDFTESGKLVPTKDLVVTAALGEVVAGKVAVREGQLVVRDELLLTLEPGDLRTLLENRLEQMAQRKRALEAQRRMTQAEHTVALEQARSSYESALWEFEMLFNEEWGIGDNLQDSAVENMLQARYTWQDAKNDPNYEGVPLNRAHSAYRQTVDGVMIARTQYSDEAKVYYSSLVASSKKIMDSLAGNNAAVESVDAAIAEMEASITLLESQLGSTEIRAPFAGVVHSLAVKEGQPLALGTPILSVASQNQLEVEAHLIATDAMTLRIGDMVVCELDNGEHFGGKVSFVAAAAQERVSTVGIVENRCLVRIVPQALPEGVGTGYGVDIKFSVVKAENVLSVPLTSVVGKGNEKAIYLLQNGRAVKTPVTTGIVAGGYVEITEGVADGDTIILLPQELELKDGTRVSVGA